MGALVGGLEAAGKLDEYAVGKLFTHGRSFGSSIRRSPGRRLPVREEILEAVREILGEVTIEELPIPFTSVATTVITGKSVWLQRGPVDDAIRASIAIPASSRLICSTAGYLPTAGVLDPIPMAPISAANADATIAVSLSGDDPNARRGDADARPTAEWLNRMWRSTSSLLDTKAARSLLEDPDRSGGVGPLSPTSDDESAEEASVPMVPGRAVRGDEPHHRHRPERVGPPHLAAYRPDLLIEVPRTVCRSLDFHRADEVIEMARTREHRARQPGRLDEKASES